MYIINDTLVDNENFAIPVDVYLMFGKSINK